MMSSILKDAIATAKFADKLQRVYPKLTRIQAVKVARGIEREINILKDKVAEVS